MFFHIAANLQKVFPMYLLKENCIPADPHSSNPCHSGSTALENLMCLTVPDDDRRLTQFEEWFGDESM